MIHLLWRSGVAAVMIWMYGHRAFREDYLGTVSAQWLREYRGGMHQNG
jgi:hypothetical protein